MADQKRKPTKCPLCQRKSSPFQAKNLPLFQCSSCQLIFQFPVKKRALTKIKPWEEKDPRFFKTTYQMKKQTFKNLFKEIKKHSSRKGQLLDVGTGTGALLEAAQENGFTAVGLEPDKKFTQEAKNRKLKVINSSLEKAKFPKHSFSFITFYDVLEHIPNPILVLKKIRSFLKPKGLLVIATPNTQSLSFQLFGQHWPHLKKEHLYYFSPKSLGILLKQSGFKILVIKSSRKALNFAYAKGYFTAFPTPFFSSITAFLGRSLPQSLVSWSISLPNGNMLAIAQKK